MMASQTTPQTSTIAPTTANASDHQYTSEYDDTLFGIWMFVLVYFFLVAIATIVTNGLTLYAIYKDPLKCFRNPLTIFITGVVVADFLFGLIGEPMMASGVAHLMKEDNEGEKHAVNAIYLGVTVSSLAITVSFLTLLALAIVQLLATGWLNRYERCVSPKSAKIGIVAIWLVTFVLYLIFAIIVHPAVTIGLAMLVVTLVTLVLVVLYIVTYRVFRRRIGQQEASLETDLVSNEFLKGTFLLVLVQILTVWPYIFTTVVLAASSRYYKSPYVVLGEAFRALTLALYLAKFFIDPIILVWRIPKYKRSMKIVYASCLGRLGCCAGGTGQEGGVGYNQARKDDDLDEHSQENAQVEVI